MRAALETTFPAVGFDAGVVAVKGLVLLRLIYLARHASDDNLTYGLLHSMSAAQAVELGIALIEEGMRLTASQVGE